MLTKVLTATVAFAAALAIVPAAYASCNNLIINLKVPGWRIVSDTSNECHHGHIQNISPDGSTALLSNTGYYGPDCRLQMSSATGTSLVEFQQNFCGLAAGNITVTPISGARPRLHQNQGVFQRWQSRKSGHQRLPMMGSDWASSAWDAPS